MYIFMLYWHNKKERMIKTSVAYFTKEVDPSLAKLQLNFKGSLAKLGLGSLLKQATGLYDTLSA